MQQKQKTSKIKSITKCLTRDIESALIL